MKKLLRISLVAILLVSLTFSAQAQDTKGENKGKRIEKLIKRLDLTDAEAARVKTILVGHFEEMKSRKQAFKGKRPSKKQMSELSDLEVERLIESRLDAEQAHLNAKRKLHADLKRVIPIKKVAKIHLALERHKRKMKRGKMKKNRKRKHSES